MQGVEVRRREVRKQGREEGEAAATLSNRGEEAAMLHWCNQRGHIRRINHLFARFSVSTPLHSYPTFNLKKKKPLSMPAFETRLSWSEKVL